MKATRVGRFTFDDDAYLMTCNGHDRQMLLGALVMAQKHHETKAQKLKTPGSVKYHARTAAQLAKLKTTIAEAADNV